MPTVRLQQASPIVGFNYSDLPGDNGDPTVVGAYPQWADDDDATYASINTADDTVETPIGEMSVTMGLLDDVIATATAFRVGVRFSTLYPNGVEPGFGEREFNIFLWSAAAYSSSDSNQGLFPVGNPGLEIPDDDGIHELVIDVAGYFAWPEAPEYYRPLLQGDGLILALTPLLREAPYDNTLTVYEAWLEVDYEAGAEVVRQFQRKDAHGLTSAEPVFAASPTAVFNSP